MAGMSSLGCVISFSRYLVLKLVISALTMGICRSVCKMVFGTYRGALTIDLRTLFWNLCGISILELLAVPQRGMNYVQMGFRIVLYISNLFPSDSFDFLPMIQCMRWSCNPSCFLLVKMCIFLPKNIFLGYSFKEEHIKRIGWGWEGVYVYYGLVHTNPPPLLTWHLCKWSFQIPKADFLPPPTQCYQPSHTYQSKVQLNHS